MLDADAVYNKHYTMLEDSTPWHSTTVLEKNVATAYKHENIMPVVKYCGGSSMIWDFFAAFGPAQTSLSRYPIG